VTWRGWWQWWRWWGRWWWWCDGDWWQHTIHCDIRHM
jgi:hypothetical protein